MKQIVNRGFTLIELLVVIAIIGILAAVVLASLNDARNSGRDASAQTSMNSVRNQAELYYGNIGSNSYGTGTHTSGTSICNHTSIETLVESINENAEGTFACNATGQDYRAHVELNNGQFFCVDANGFAGQVDDPPSSSSDRCD